MFETIEVLSEKDLVTHIALDLHVWTVLTEMLPGSGNGIIFLLAIRANVLLLEADVEQVVEQLEHGVGLGFVLPDQQVGLSLTSVLERVLLQLLDHHFGAKLLNLEGELLGILAIGVGAPAIRRVLVVLDHLLARLADNGHTMCALLQLKRYPLAFSALQALKHGLK